VTHPAPQICSITSSQSPHHGQTLCLFITHSYLTLANVISSTPGLTTTLILLSANYCPTWDSQLFSLPTMDKTVFLFSSITQPKCQVPASKPSSSKHFLYSWPPLPLHSHLENPNSGYPNLSLTWHLYPIYWLSSRTL
jgi:hypothetical protein